MSKLSNKTWYLSRVLNDVMNIIKEDLKDHNIIKRPFYWKLSNKIIVTIQEREYTKIMKRVILQNKIF